MIKYIGIGITLLGILLLAINLIKGKRTGIAEDRKELKMITEAGYGSQHVALERKKAAFEGQTPIKQPKKRRPLSKEAQDILDLVEKDKEEAAKKAHDEKKRKSKNEFPPKPKKQGTDILEQKSSSKKGTEILSRSQSKKKDTDVLQERKAKKGTDVLSREDAPEKKGTDVLSTIPKKMEDEAPAGTDILTDTANKATGTEDLTVARDMKNGTDILDQPSRRKAGTDILDSNKTEKKRGSKGSGTAILQKKTGTDILKKGTDVLQEKKGTDVLERRE